MKSKKGANPDDKTVYLRCNRDAVFQTGSKSTGKRAPKKVLKDGPSQISQACTAGVIKTIQGGRIFVKAYPTHANHPIDKRHKHCLDLPQTFKSKVEDQIKMGVKLPSINAEINLECDEQYPQCISNPTVPQVKEIYQNLHYLKKILVDD